MFQLSTVFSVRSSAKVRYQADMSSPTDVTKRGSLKRGLSITSGLRRSKSSASKFSDLRMKISSPVSVPSVDSRTGDEVDLDKAADEKLEKYRSQVVKLSYFVREGFK